MSDCVPVVQQDAYAQRLALVLRDYIRLDSHAAPDDVGGDILLKREQRVPVRLKCVQQIAVKNQPVLDGFRPAGCQLALGQRLQCADIDQHKFGLVERAPRGSCLAAGQRRPLPPTAASIIASRVVGTCASGKPRRYVARDETREVAHNATADCDYHMPTLCLALCEPAIYELHRFQRLVRLAGRHYEHVRGDAGSFERELRAPRLSMHTLIGDDVRGGHIENGIDALANLVDSVPAHPYRVVPLC